MRPWVIAALLAIPIALPIARPAHADEGSSTVRAVVDQVMLEPSSLGGQRLQLTLSMWSLEGQNLDLPEPDSLRLVVNGSRTDAPFSIGAFSGTGRDLAIVFVVQTSIDFTEVLPVIGEAIDQNVLATLPEHAQVAVLPYGESQGAGKLGSVKAARSRVNSLASDGTVADPALLDTVERAMSLLKKAKTDPEGRPIRKAIVLVSDGRDVSADRDRVTRIGTRAGKDGIRIHSFAYSPKKQHRPLLLLGELSKRSLGTFRWVRGARSDSWTPAFGQLAAQLGKQHVLTYFLPTGEDVSGGKLKLELTGRLELVTNEHKIPDVTCAGTTCPAGAYCAADRCVTPREERGRGVLGWIAIVVGIVVGALVVLGVIGYFLTKRQQAAAARPPVPAGSLPPHASGAPASQPPAPVASQPPVPQAPITGGRLYIVSGPYAGREVAIKHGFQIGKAPGCDLLLDDGFTSSHHAQIAIDHLGNAHIYDNASTNGLFVNGVKVTHHPLEHGTSIRIGSTELRYLAQ